MKRTDLLKLWAGLIILAIGTIVAACLFVLAVPVLMCKPSVLDSVKDDAQRTMTKHMMKSVMKSNRRKMAA